MHGAATVQGVHRHGLRTHSHAWDAAHPHRHLPLLPWGSRPVTAAEHGHSHGLVDASIKRSRDGLKAVGLSLAVLGLTAAAQTVIFVATGSVALLADLIHNFGDALTAVPLAVAFALRSERAERAAGYFVIAAIFASACVAGVEAVRRLFEPNSPDHLGALVLAGVIGVIGNLVAAAIRGRAGRRRRADRRRQPCACRRLRVAGGDRLGRGCRRRGPDRRSVDRTRDHRDHPADHLAVVADRQRARPRPLGRGHRRPQTRGSSG
jgi:Cation efflux family